MSIIGIVGLWVLRKKEALTNTRVHPETGESLPAGGTSKYYDIVFSFYVKISCVVVELRRLSPIICNKDTFPKKDFGIAIVALPAGIITAGYMDIINEEKKDTEEKD